MDCGEILHTGVEQIGSCGGHKEAEVIEAVSLAVPAPVDVQVGIGIISIDNVCVSATRIGGERCMSGEKHRITVVEFFLHHIHPFRCGVFVMGIHAGIVAEVLGKSGSGIGIIRTTLVGGVLHSCGISAIAHQCSHGVFLGVIPIRLTVNEGVCGEHVVPIVGGLRKIVVDYPHFSGVIAVIQSIIRFIGDRAITLLGPAVVIHDLSHGCGNTASVNIGGGALVVIRCELIPLCLHKRIHHRGSLFCLDCSCCGFRHRSHRCSHFVEPSGECRGHIRGIDAAMVGISEQRSHAIVAGYDGKSLLMGCVKHIIWHHFGTAFRLGAQLSAMRHCDISPCNSLGIGARYRSREGGEIR